MKIKMVLIGGWMVALSGSLLAETSKDPLVLVKEMVQTVGPMGKLKDKKDVQYTYTYLDKATGKKDVSIERYVFDGEYSWGKYTQHEKHVFPNQPGEVIQGFNGKETWVTHNGQLIEDPAHIKGADFMRKTNFYWFAMMQKLLDPGINYSYEGVGTVNGRSYDLVKVTFDDGVGDASDIYILYINPETKLVDQFLFTVMDFGMKEPLLMIVEYESVEGLLLPAKRRYIQSNWQGEEKGTGWTFEIMEDIQFNNGFRLSDFNNPRI